MMFLVDYHTLRDSRTSLYTRHIIRNEIQRRLCEFMRDEKNAILFSAEERTAINYTETEINKITL